MWVKLCVWNERQPDIFTLVPEYQGLQVVLTVKFSSFKANLVEVTGTRASVSPLQVHLMECANFVSKLY